MRRLKLYSYLHAAAKIILLLALPPQEIHTSRHRSWWHFPQKHFTCSHVVSRLLLRRNYSVPIIPTMVLSRVGMTRYHLALLAPLRLEVVRLLPGLLRRWGRGKIHPAVLTVVVSVIVGG